MVETLLAACKLVTDTIYNGRNDIGLADVKFGGLPKLTKFPACMIMAGELTRIPEASGRQTELTFSVLVYVLHTDITKDLQTRTEEDMLMAEAVTTYLHSDFTFGGQLAGSWISVERPRPIPGKRAAHHVLTTELTWTGKSRGRIGT